MKKNKPMIYTTLSGKSVMIRTCTVGQYFGTAAQVMLGRRVIATTGPRPYGFTTAAIADAVALLSTL